MLLGLLSVKTTQPNRADKDRTTELTQFVVSRLVEPSRDLRHVITWLNRRAPRGPPMNCECN